MYMSCFVFTASLTSLTRPTLCTCCKHFRTLRQLDTLLGIGSFRRSMILTSPPSHYSLHYLTGYLLYLRLTALVSYPHLLYPSHTSSSPSSTSFFSIFPIWSYIYDILFCDNNYLCPSIHAPRDNCRYRFMK